MPAASEPGRPTAKIRSFGYKPRYSRHNEPLCRATPGKEVVDQHRFPLETQSASKSRPVSPADEQTTGKGCDCMETFWRTGEAPGKQSRNPCSRPDTSGHQ